MSLFGQDPLKAKELSVIIIEPDSQRGQQLRQIALRMGVKNCPMFKSIDEYLSKSMPPCDVLWLDVPENEALAAADWADQLIYSQRISPKQLLILLCHTESTSLASDYPYHNVVCLQHPVTHAQIEQQMRQFVQGIQVLRPIQSLGHLGRFADALKLVQFHLPKTTLAPTRQTLERLHLQILVDTHQIDSQNPQLRQACQQHHWAWWLLFQTMYHRDSPELCIEALLKPGNQFNKNPERRDSYLLYLYLLQGDANTAFQIARNIPAAQLTPRLARLVYLTSVLAGDATFASQLLEKKRKIHPRGKMAIHCHFMEARALLYASYRQPSAANAQSLRQRLTELITSIQDDPCSTGHTAELLMLRADLARLEGRQDEAAELIREMPKGQRNPLLVPAWCHAAVLAASLGQTAYCMDSIWQALQAAYHAPDSNQRIYGLCLLQQTLKLIPSKAREIESLLELATEQGDIWGAAELTFLSLVGQQQLTEMQPLLQPLGFQRVHGISF